MTIDYPDQRQRDQQLWQMPFINDETNQQSDAQLMNLLKPNGLESVDSLFNRYSNATYGLPFAQGANRLPDLFGGQLENNEQLNEHIAHCNKYGTQDFQSSLEAWQKLSMQRGPEKQVKATTISGKQQIEVQQKPTKKRKLPKADYSIAEGAGYERNAQAFKSIAKGTYEKRQVGPWLGSSHHHRRMGDLRHVEDRPVTTNVDSHGCWVPGWIGISTDKKKGIKWSPSYVGEFETYLFDRECAVNLRIPVTGNVEELARIRDIITIAYESIQQAETNYDVEEYALIDFGSVYNPKIKSTVPCALKLIRIEQSIPYDCMVSSVTPQELHEWELQIMRNFCQKYPTDDGGAELGKQLAWLLQRIKPDVLPSDWNGQVLEGFIHDCATCKTVGTKNDFYHSQPEQEKIAMIMQHEKNGVPSKIYNKYNQRTFQSLLRIAQSEILAQVMMRLEIAPSTKNAQSDAGQTSGGPSKGNQSQGKLLPKISTPGRDSIHHSFLKSIYYPRFQQRDIPLQANFVQQNDIWWNQNPVPQHRLVSVSKLTTLQPLKVLVIGGGISGLIAAQNLIRAGATVTLLEAKNTLGGRLQTIQLRGDNSDEEVTADLGPSVIAGGMTCTDDGSSNPISRILQKIGGSLYETSAQKIKDSQPIDPLEEQNILQALSETVRYLLLQSVQIEVQGSFTILSALQRIPELVQAQANKETLYQLMSDLFPAPLGSINLMGNIRDSYTGVNGAAAGGLAQITQAIKQGISAEHDDRVPVTDINLRQVVEVIDYSQPTVRVKVAGKPDPYTADVVLVTVPLGVLKASCRALPTWQQEFISNKKSEDQKKYNGIQFVPPLPDPKVNSIRRMGFGQEERVLLLFQRRFWEADTFVISPPRGPFLFYNYDAIGVPNTLCAVVRAPQVPTFQQFTTIQLLVQVEIALKQLYPNSYEDPDGYRVSRWGSDPFFFGSASYCAEGGSPEDFDELSKPLPYVNRDKNVFFAGEATLMQEHGTIAGAYYSGIWQAKNIVELHNGRNLQNVEDATEQYSFQQETIQ